MKYIKIKVNDDFDDTIEQVTIEYPTKSAQYPDIPDSKKIQCDIWRPQYKNILDKGFLGLVDFMGNDQTVVDAARVSYGTGTRRVSEDHGLIRYLIRNRHWTPIEMIEIMWHVRAPIFVFRQWHRHRACCLNEQSARYSVMTDDIYMPNPSVMKPQSSANKQGRDGAINENNIDACLLQIEHAYKESIQAYHYLLGETTTPSTSLLKRKELVQDFAIQQIRVLQDTNKEWSPDKVTDKMIDTKIQEIADAHGLSFTDGEFHDSGLSRELARMVMPLGTYSEMYWKCDLRNTFNFISLRSDPHAQHEIKVYSDQMLSLIEQIAPICVAAFIDYQLKGKSLSKMEVDVVRLLYKKLNIANQDYEIDLTIEDTMKEAGAGKREIREFLDNLKNKSNCQE